MSQEAFARKIRDTFGIPESWIDSDAPTSAQVFNALPKPADDTELLYRGATPSE